MTALLICAAIIASLWGGAFAVAGIRRLISGPYVPEYIGPAFVIKYQAQAAKEAWLHRILVVFDIFLNVAVLRGQQDETMSGRAWRASLEGKKWGRVLNYWLDLIQPQHGPKAAAGDLWRAEQRVAFNKKALGIQ